MFLSTKFKCNERFLVWIAPNIFVCKLRLMRILPNTKDIPNHITSNTNNAFCWPSCDDGKWHQGLLFTGPAGGTTDHGAERYHASTGTKRSRRSRSNREVALLCSQRCFDDLDNFWCNMLTGDINCSPKRFGRLVFNKLCVCFRHDLSEWICRIYIDFDYRHASDRYRAIVRTVKWWSLHLPWINWYRRYEVYVWELSMWRKVRSISVLLVETKHIWQSIHINQKYLEHHRTSENCNVFDFNIFVVVILGYLVYATIHSCNGSCWSFGGLPTNKTTLWSTTYVDWSCREW